MRAMVCIALLVGAAPAAADPATSLRCIRTQQIKEARQVAGQGYFVRTGKGWWRNAAQACSAFGPDRTLITRIAEAQLCRGDIVDVVNLQTGFSHGSCGLDEWQKVDAPPPK